MKYAICEILGRQYLVEPGKAFFVDNLGDIKELKVEKVLLLADDDKVEVGSPYLKNILNFEILRHKKDKIRVATYKSKTNHRRVIGQVRETTQIRLVQD